MYTYLKIPALTVTLGLVFASAGFADTREERLAAATEYNNAAMADTDMEAMIRTMWEPLVAQMAPEADEDQREQVHALYMETFEPKMEQLMSDQPEIMADIFTLQEIEDLRDFYATDTGRSVMQKLPQMTQAIQPAIMQMVQDTIPTVIPQVQQILQPQQ